MSENEKTRRHASCVSWQGRGALILGASGSGKSSLALQLMALGCDLVADDQTEVFLQNNELFARCPKTIEGRIEARGFGILTVPFIAHSRLVCAVVLDQTEAKRLPVPHHISLCGRALRLFHNPGIGHLPFALIQYLKGSAGFEPVSG